MEVYCRWGILGWTCIVFVVGILLGGGVLSVGVEVYCQWDILGWICIDFVGGDILGWGCIVGRGGGVLSVGYPWVGVCCRWG